MSDKKAEAEIKLLTTYLSETEKLLRRELSSEEREDVIAKLKKHWQWLNVRSLFDEYLNNYKLRSLEASELFEVKSHLCQAFGEEATIAVEPNSEAGTLSVSVELPGGKLEGTFNVEPKDEEAPTKVQFVPFLPCLSTDTGLAWSMAHAETMSVVEARIALNNLEADFWASKKALNLLKKRVIERTFAAFIENVPAAALRERSLKRHYKTPAVIKAVDAESDSESETPGGPTPSTEATPAEATPSSEAAPSEPAKSDSSGS